MGAMEELVHDGKVRHIGVSNFSVRETNEAQAALSKNEVVSNQVEYSLTSRSVEADILPYCSREKISLIAYSPLARGNIPESSIPMSLQYKYKMTPAQIMLNWVTRNKQVLAIPKSTSLSHLEENASSPTPRFTDSEYEQIADVS